MLRFWVLLCIFSNTALAELSRDEINQRNLRRANIFLNELMPKERQRVNEAIARINNHNKERASDGLIHFGKIDKGQVFLLVQGLPDKNGEDRLAEWYQTIDFLFQKSQEFYFQGIFRKLSPEDNIDKIKSSIVKIRKDNRDKKIVIFAHSTGGVLTTVALQKLKKTFHNLSKVEFYTLASPYNGYNAPKIFKLFTASFGKLNVEIGIGLKKYLLPKVKLNNCTHYITVNPQNDHHGGNVRGIFPQFITFEERNQVKTWQEAYLKTEFPCSNVIFRHENTHYDIIDHAMFRYWYYK